MQQTRKPGPQRALVLAGGGAKGSYQVGVWQALQELGWTPDETFTSGMRKTVQWYLANEAWWRQVQDGSYQGERLGLHG